MNMNKTNNMRLDIYFSLTKKQQRKFNELGYSWQLVENVTINEMFKVTKSKKIIEQLKTLKQMSIRLVA